MAHFARINENNIVEEVLVVPNEQEHRGQDFLAIDLGLGGTWIQTSYNNNFRKNYAGYGFYYDEVKDAFIPPKYFPSWVLNEETCLWEAPTPQPTPEYYWNEELLEWVLE